MFRALTDPKQVGKWWGPTGFTTTTHEMSVKPGGAWRFIMHGPDGTDYDNEILYLEVVKPERLVYDHGEPGKPGYFKVWITFDEEAGKTRLTMRSLFETAAARDYVVQGGQGHRGRQSDPGPPRGPCRGDAALARRPLAAAASATAPDQGEAISAMPMLRCSACMTALGEAKSTG